MPQDIPQTVTVRNGRFRIERGYDPSVRVPEMILDCVGFIGEVTHRDEQGVSGDLHATGFFAFVPCEAPRLREEKIGFVYFVTARHVQHDLANREIYFLVNKVGGGVTTIRDRFGDLWWTHPTDKTADVAITQVIRQADANIGSVSVDQFATPELLNQLQIGIGDEIFCTGLFTPAPGSAKNIPIVRHGNIAMMPEEQIQTELGYADVYLVEVRSLGGLSGSPVFVRPTLNAKLPVEQQRGTVKNSFSMGHGGTLLGLMHGHWDIREEDMNRAFFTQDRKHGVNMGIAIVVPAIKILETINHPEVVMIRKKAEAAMLIKRSMVPSMDSARQEKKEQESQSFTQKDFEDALKKASRKTTAKK